MTSGRSSSKSAAGSTARADLKLVKTKNLPAQLTNGEWLHSAPGTAQQKRPLLSCVGCHQLGQLSTEEVSVEVIHRGVGAVALLAQRRQLLDFDEMTNLGHHTAD